MSTITPTFSFPTPTFGLSPNSNPPHSPSLFLYIPCSGTPTPYHSPVPATPHYTAAYTSAVAQGLFSQQNQQHCSTAVGGRTPVNQQHSTGAATAAVPVGNSLQAVKRLTVMIPQEGTGVAAAQAQVLKPKPQASNLNPTTPVMLSPYTLTLLSSLG